MSGRKAKEQRRKGERLSPAAKIAERAFARAAADHIAALEESRELASRERRERRRVFSAGLGLALFAVAMALLALTVVLG